MHKQVYKHVANIRVEITQFKTNSALHAWGNLHESPTPNYL